MKGSESLPSKCGSVSVQAPHKGEAFRMAMGQTRNDVLPDGV